MFSNNKIGGINIIGILFLAVILILAFNYFHLSVQISVNNPDTENSVSGGGVLTNIWNTYFKQPIDYIWNDIISKYFWQPFMDTMIRIGNSEWTSSQDDMPELLPTGNSQ